jgi:hypothetical protein
MDVGDRVKVLGEAYSPDDDEDMATATVSAVSIPRGRKRTEVTMAKAGNWVLLEGVDANIAKTATITSASAHDDTTDDDVQIFAPLKFPEVHFLTCLFTRFTFSSLCSVSSNSFLFYSISFLNNGPDAFRRGVRLS